MKFRSFLTDPKLGGLADESFKTWHVVASLLDGDAHLLSADELAIAYAITGRSRFPTAAIRRFYAGLGRRAGKTLFESRRACYFAARDYRDRLQKGETAVIACIATDKRQAALLFSYARACVLASPLLSAQLIGETADTLEFAHSTALEIHAASFRSTRGRTFAAVLMDEAAFLRSEESAQPDVEIVRAVIPGLATLNGSLEVFSSLHMRRGLMWNAHRQHYGNDDSAGLYVQGETRQFNPTIDQAVIDEASQEDPEAAATEWGGQFRNDLSAAFAPEWIDAAVDSNVFEREPANAPGMTIYRDYESFTDPAGGQGRDSWSTYITHAEGNEVIADAVLEIRPPFSTKEAAKRVAEFLKRYGIHRTRGDAYAGAWPADELAANGIGYTLSELNKSEIYKECVGLFSAGRIRLIDHARTLTQLRMLERRVRPGGRENFDHPGGSHDDNSNALCGALLAAALPQGESMPVWSAQSELSQRGLLELGGVNVAPKEFVSAFDATEDHARNIWSELERF